MIDLHELQRGKRLRKAAAERVEVGADDDHALVSRGDGAAAPTFDPPLTVPVVGGDSRLNQALDHSP